jgi:hypothetical protein
MRLALLVLILSSRPCWAIDATAEDFEFFENNIRPVLVEHCYECHSSQSPNAKGGLLLDLQQGLVEGGDSGASLVPLKWTPVIGPRA